MRYYVLPITLALLACSDTSKTNNKEALTNSEKKSLSPTISPLSSSEHKPVANAKNRKNSSNEETLLPADSLHLTAVMGMLAKVPAEYVLNTQHDTTITCKEGTIVHVPAYSFVDANGNVVTGLVQFKVTEYYTAEDIILNGLHSMSGDKMLESGGMLNLEAYANNQSIRLGNGKSIEVEIPTREFKPDMQLFNAVQRNGKIDWVLATNSNNEKKKIQTEDATNKVKRYHAVSTIVGSKLFKTKRISNPEARLSKQSDTLFYELNFDRNGNLKGGKFIRGTGKFVKTDIRINYTINAITQSTSLRFAKNTFEFYTIEHVALEKRKEMRKMPNNRKIPTYTIHRCSSPISKTDLIKNFSKKDRKGLSTVKVQEIVQEDNFTSITPEESQKELEAFANGELSDNDASSLSYYSLNVMKLGLINCDRFYSDPRPKFVLKVPPSNGCITYSLVFQNQNSFMRSDPSKNWEKFMGIPAGEKILLVAMKVENKELHLAMHMLQLKDNSKLTNLNFKKVKADELAKEIAAAKKLELTKL
jgi:hypothetical protein